MRLPEFAHIAHPQLLPLGFLQLRQQRVDRADAAPFPGFHGGAHDTGQHLAVVGQRGRIGPTIAEAVAHLAVGIEIKGRGDMATADQHHAAAAQSMPHPELVPDVGVVNRQVSQHQIGEQQLLKHVGADISSAHLLIGTEGIQAGLFERGLNQLRVDAVEVDAAAISRRLGAERHHHKGVGAAEGGGEGHRRSAGQ